MKPSATSTTPRSMRLPSLISKTTKLVRTSIKVMSMKSTLLMRPKSEPTRTKTKYKIAKKRLMSSLHVEALGLQRLAG